MGLIKDLLSTLIIVGIIAGGGYAITGSWPFMVAVQSGSMEPHIHVGDVIFLLSPERKQVITFVEGKSKGYEMFGNYGDVIVYKPNGNGGTPIIHRAIAYVKRGDFIPILIKKNNSYILAYSNVRAENDGYITQGDANPIPDQLAGVKPVKKNWIIGVAVFRIPYIGYVRLIFNFF